MLKKMSFKNEHEDDHFFNNEDQLDEDQRVFSAHPGHKSMRQILLEHDVSLCPSTTTF